MRTIAVALSLLAVVGGVAAAPGPVDDVVVTGASDLATGKAAVVVAQFDTGVNPFHPCFRRPTADPSTIPGIPDEIIRIRPTFTDDYRESLEESRSELDEITDGELHHVVGTNILYYGDRGGLVDDYPHGSMAASQVVCEEFGLAPEAWLLVLNWYDVPSRAVPDMAWVARQPWVDVVHLNIQDLGPFPVPTDREQGIAALRDAGKYVVIAAGNGAAGIAPPYPAETAGYNMHRGTHLAGANDGTGYAWYSNLDPHTVMDGAATRAAEADGLGETTFSGTSSASPRTAGYVARVLLEVRRATGGGRGEDGLVVASPRGDGPLADGVLTAAELFDAVRHTADPSIPADPILDGDDDVLFHVPRPPVPDGSDYVQVGYGKLTTTTLWDTIDVVLGLAEPRERPVADAFFTASDSYRERVGS